MDNKTTQSEESSAGNRVEHLSPINRLIIPKFRSNYSTTFEADACLPLIDAVAHDKIKMEAMVHGHYPGKQLPKTDITEVCSVGYWDANNDQSWGLDWHRNEGIEITYLTKGFLDFSVDDKHYELVPGSLTITRPWQKHCIGSPNINASQLHWVILDVGVRLPHSEWKWPDWILFSKKDMLEFSRLLRGDENCVWHTGDKIGKCFEKIQSTVKTKTPYAAIMPLKLQINELLYEFYQYLKGEVKEVDESLSSSLRTVEFYLKDLQNHLSPNLSVTLMAEECGLARTQFSEYCQRLTNRAPLRYLNDIRMQVAKKGLLKDQNIKISKVSELCGFLSVNYFSRFFKKETGYTPVDFRKKFGQSSK